MNFKAGTFYGALKAENSSDFFFKLDHAKIVDHFKGEYNILLQM